MKHSVVEPRNPSEFRKALQIKRAGIHRVVEVYTSKSVYSDRVDSDHHFDIFVVPGSKLEINIRSGLPFLTVRQGSAGRVVVTFSSSWGNSITIAEYQGVS